MGEDDDMRTRSMKGTACDQAPFAHHPREGRHLNLIILWYAVFVVTNYSYKLVKSNLNTASDHIVCSIEYIWFSR